VETELKIRCEEEKFRWASIRDGMYVRKGKKKSMLVEKR
jgi:hypothetical protein